MAQLDVEGVTLTFGGVAALSGVSMRVEAGELVSIIGPNGAGKTSLLNCISGFYHPERGRILFEGQDLTRASPHEVTRKGIARAFQNIELFSGLTVLENLLLARHTHLSYGLLQAGLFYGRALAEEVRNRRVVEEVIDFMELEPYRKALVGNLPYGVRKRVEVARALALSPKLLLLDEPLGALDLRLREELLFFLRRTLKEEGVTTLLVTHDQGEAFLLAHRVALLREGRLVQVGRPEEVYARPKDPWAARFLGHKNLLSPGESQALGLPPKAHLLPPRALALGGSLEGVVEERLFFGPRVGLWVRVGGVRLYLEAPEGPEEGAPIALRLDPAQAVPLEG